MLMNSLAKFRLSEIMIQDVSALVFPDGSAFTYQWFGSTAGFLNVGRGLSSSLSDRDLE